MSAATRMRVGVLVSGSGTNLQALIDAARGPDYPAELVLVVSNVPTAGALTRARDAGIEALTVDHTSFPNREAFDAALLEALQSRGVELLCLAGFMRLLGPTLLRAFPQRVLNIHPALLPAFPGLHGARQALAHGVKMAGCTVHLVDEGLDSGPILVQAAVPVHEGDVEATLAARILEQEHRIYPLAVRWVAEGRVTLEGRRVRIRGAESEAAAIANPRAAS